METQVILKASCPQCGHEVRFPKPEAPGKYALTCPECKNKFAVQFGEKQIQMQAQGQPSGDAASQSQQASSAPQQAPASTETVMLTRTQREHVGAATGSRSGGTPTMARLVQHRRLWKNIEHRLQTGSNTVGRADDLAPSTIQISGDSTMSRRSIDIEVTQEQGLYYYLMHVLKAKNPVTVNGTPRGNGESIFLAPGDTILLGSTTFTLEL